jgi:2-polyprenyl-3-methyl-5-hydroxy-6-metoxy-1,4-benzoquinol methylase
MRNPYKLSKAGYSTHSIIINSTGNQGVVLDVGCNDGYIGKDSHKDVIFYGLDYLSESVVKAKKVYKDAHVYDLNNLQKLPWDIQFDTIIFADVLEHVIYPEKTLQFFVDNYLQSKGKVIISLPNIANWQIRLQLLFGKFDYTETGIMDKTHLHLYTFKSAKQLLEKSGLHITATFGGASFFGKIITYFPWLKSLLATNIIYTCEKVK